MIKLEQNNKIEKNIDYLKDITKDLAKEIDLNEHGPIISLLEIIFDNIESLVFIINTDDIIIFINKSAIEYMSRVHGCDGACAIGKTWYCSFCDEKPDEGFIHDRAMNERRVLTEVFDSPFSDNKFEITAIPLVYNGTTGTICIMNIIDGNE